MGAPSPSQVPTPAGGRPGLCTGGTHHGHQPAHPCRPQPGWRGGAPPTDESPSLSLSGVLGLEAASGSLVAAAWRD